MPLLGPMPLRCLHHGRNEIHPDNTEPALSHRHGFAPPSAADIQNDVIPQQEDGAFMSWCPATAESMTGDAKQAYRPVLLNAKYMKQAWAEENPGPLVQIEGLSGEAEACSHD